MTAINTNIFRILSIDGGGIRGVFPAHIIQCLKDRMHVDVFNDFDMFAGTSTGAIIAAGIACKLDPGIIVSLYKEHGSQIFGSRIRSWCPHEAIRTGLHSKYINTPLRDVLEDTFGNIRLGDIEKPLILPATNVGNGCVHVFKSGYPKSYTRDGHVYVRDAVLASCSAPTYFDPVEVGPYLLADGGLWANNPSLAALVDALHQLKIGLERIRLLSLGTGTSKAAYGVNPNRRWGLLTGWEHIQFASLVMSLQTESTNSYLELMLGDQICRVSFRSDKPLPLDDVSAMGDLISSADTQFSNRSHELKRIMNLKEGE